MVSKTLTLTNGSGFHMRPAQVFASAMAPFESDVTLVVDGKEINGKSLMAIVASGVKCGAEVEVRADGPDEDAAIAEAVKQIESGLGE